MVTFTEEQMAALEPYEGRMQSALRSDWCPAISAREFNAVLAIYNNATKSIRSRHPDCAACVLELMQDVGRIYFATRDANARKVEQSLVRAEKRAKIAVKTTKQQYL